MCGFLENGSTGSSGKPVSAKAIGLHLILLAKFLVLSIILSSLDVYTDIRTAETFFKHNHIYWGMSTMLFVFLPFIGQLFVYVFILLKIILKRQDAERCPTKSMKLRLHLDKSVDLFWHVPPFSLIR